MIRVLQRFDSVDGWADVTGDGRYNGRRWINDAVQHGATHFTVRIRLNSKYQDKYDRLFMLLDFSADELTAPRIRPDWDRAVYIESNQAKRPALLLAVDDRRQLALYEYAMPAGTTALAVLPADADKQQQSVSYAALPRYWFDLIRDQFSYLEYDGSIRMALCGQSQNGRTYSFPETGYVMSSHLNELYGKQDRLDRQSDWF